MKKILGFILLYALNNNPIFGMERNWVDEVSDECVLLMTQLLTQPIHGIHDAIVLGHSFKMPNFFVQQRKVKDENNTKICTCLNSNLPLGTRYLKPLVSSEYDRAIGITIDSLVQYT